MLSSMAFQTEHSIIRPQSPQDTYHAILNTHIADALSRSPDRGATLILSKSNISEFDASAIHALVATNEDATEGKSSLERLAFAYNHLSSLPNDFTLLLHLRYINLKHNNFSVFPHVLTGLPSLEIIDISHNKITMLPLQPGQLVNLKVLCLSRNKLTRIPSYIVQFHRLEVFQVDRNPIEWPPSAVVDGRQSGDSLHTMKDWIQTLKDWIGSHPKSTFDEEPSYFDLNREESWQYPTKEHEQIDIISHMRSCSMESSFSFTSIPESISELAAENPADPEPHGAPELQFDSVDPHSNDSSPAKSAGSSVASPAESESYDRPSAMTSVGGTFDAPIQHNRNASYAGHGQFTHRSEILAKMSMPDLRSAKVDFTKKSSTDLLPSSDEAYTTNDSTRGQLSRYPGMSLSIDTGIRTSTSFVEENDDKTTSRATYSMTSERNSYFRRLSAFPAPITLPQSLLCLVDTARSMLFAACQVYQTLDHYIVHVDERLSSVLRKVLEPASCDMLQLISALDRFDSISRKMLPPPATCRAVVESCKDTAAAFSKVVKVLTFQLQVLTTCDDVRYSRLLLVELYAATAEIASAWKRMLPQIHHLKSLLHMNRLAGHHGNSASETKSILPLESSASAPRYPSSSAPTGMSTSVGRARTIRRHAGSFSSKDVEIGKQLPSYDEPYRGNGPQGRPQTFRMPRRQATTPVLLPSAQSSSPIPVNPTPLSRSPPHGLEPDHGHSRNDSQSSIHAMSLSSSPILPSKVITSFELPSNSRSQVDKEALRAIKEAVDIAPTVWNMIEDSLEDVLSVRANFREELNKARIVTKRLASMVIALQENDGLSDRKLLREDARLFLKAVVQLSSAIKTSKEAQDVSPALRNGMVKLTNATEEFAILLHVSSFSPSTPRSFTPIVNSPVPPTYVVQLRDSQLGSSLSRSRSTQAPSGTRSPATEYLDGSFAQSFVPPVRHTRQKGSP
ncbi:hypothetical protein APHAL10511_001266 [Amanita phalloides]|nr:hypothetical protein APHAL10511_001266 [Amanita phalloides]